MSLLRARWSLIFRIPAWIFANVRMMSLSCARSSASSFLIHSKASSICWILSFSVLLEECAIISKRALAVGRSEFRLEVKELFSSEKRRNGWESKPSWEIPSGKVLSLFNLCSSISALSNSRETFFNFLNSSSSSSRCSFVIPLLIFAAGATLSRLSLVRGDGWLTTA